MLHSPKIDKHEVKSKYQNLNRFYTKINGSSSSNGSQLTGVNFHYCMEVNFTSLLKYYWLPNSRFQRYRKPPTTRGQEGNNGSKLPGDGRVCDGAGRCHHLSSPCASVVDVYAASRVCLYFCLLPFSPLSYQKLYQLVFCDSSNSNASQISIQKVEKEFVCVILWISWRVKARRMSIGGHELWGSNSGGRVIRGYKR